MGRTWSDQPLMNGEDLVLSLDEGTTGATAVAVGMDGDVRGKGYQEITQHYPRPGWVEHDPNEIWSAVQLSAKRALDDAGATTRDVRAVGITNQRETLVMWDRKTLQPIAPAIVWQDRRTADECARLREAGHEQRVREITGLVLDPYFTATRSGGPCSTSRVRGTRPSARSTHGWSRGSRRGATTSPTRRTRRARFSSTSGAANGARRWPRCSVSRSTTCRRSSTPAPRSRSRAR